MYLATAWVIAVMLPPAAIFLPCFTLREDFAFLPRERLIAIITNNFSLGTAVAAVWRAFA